MNAIPHHISWQQPRPLWRGSTLFAHAPQILRFDTDEFMERVIATLKEDPNSLSSFIAKPETWRTPPRDTETPDHVERVPLPETLAATKRKRLFSLARPAQPAPAVAASQPLKLFQPVHMRHYLVAGSLTCAVPGLPEHVLASQQESVGFLVRRLLPASASSAGDQTLVEFAFVKDKDDQRWLRVAQDEVRLPGLAPGEEILPLFKLPHLDGQGRTRGLWAGLIPVARREDYLGKRVERTSVALAQGQANALNPAPPPAPAVSKSARLMKFKMDVAEPWKALIRAAAKASEDVLQPPGGTPDQDRWRQFDFNLQFQMSSWLILLDFADWLEAYLPTVWSAIKAGSSTGLTGDDLSLYSRLQSANADSLVAAMRDPRVPEAPPPPQPADLKPMAPSLASALAKIRASGVRESLEAKKTHYARAGALAKEGGWPAFHFPLAGLTRSSAVDGAFTGAVASLPSTPIEGDTPSVSSPPSAPAGKTDIAEMLDKFTALVGRALPAKIEDDVQGAPFALKLRDSILATAGDDGLFVIRFVYVNRDCGPLHPPILSQPTVRFKMANFFDPDAPVRPIRITLPMDTSPAGLRKHARGTAFVLSDMLCGQVQRAKGLGFVDLVRQVLPFPLHKDIDIGDGGSCKSSGGIDIGMICSLSIPIITLCALIMLIIMVTLLDFVFRWLPWFILCLPVPGLKGKQGGSS